MSARITPVSDKSRRRLYEVKEGVEDDVEEEGKELPNETNIIDEQDERFNDLLDFLNFGEIAPRGGSLSSLSTPVGSGADDENTDFIVVQENEQEVEKYGFSKELLKSRESDMSDNEEVVLGDEEDAVKSGKTEELLKSRESKDVHVPNNSETQVNEEDQVRNELSKELADTKACEEEETTSNDIRVIKDKSDSEVNESTTNSIVTPSSRNILGENDMKGTMNNAVDIELPNVAKLIISSREAKGQDKCYSPKSKEHIVHDERFNKLSHGIEELLTNGIADKEEHHEVNENKSIEQDNDSIRRLIMCKGDDDEGDDEDIIVLSTKKERSSKLRRYDTKEVIEREKSVTNFDDPHSFSARLMMNSLRSQGDESFHRSSPMLNRALSSSSMVGKSESFMDEIRPRPYIDGNFDKGLIYELDRVDNVSSISFSSDGKYLAISERSNVVTVISAMSWKVMEKIERGGDVIVVRFSQNGEYLAVGGEDNKVAVVSTSTWQIVHLMERRGYVTAASFSLDGNFLAVGGGDKKVAIIAIHSSWTVVHKYEREGLVNDVSFSPDGKFLAIGGVDRKVVLVSLAASWEIVFESEHSNSITSLSFSPNGQYLAIGGDDKKVAVLSLISSLEIVREIERGGCVTSVSFSPNDMYLAIGGRDKKVALLSTSCWEVIHEVERDDAVKALDFSCDSKSLVFGGNDRRVGVMLLSPSWEVHCELPQMKNVAAVCFSRDGRFLAVGGQDKQVLIFSTLTWDVVLEVKLRSIVTTISFCSNGRYFAVGGGVAAVVSSSSGRIVREAKSALAQSAASISPDGKYLASGGYDDKFTVVVAASGGFIHDAEREGIVCALSFSPDGRYLAVAGEDRKVAFVSTSCWDVVHEVERKGAVRVISFSSDGNYLAAGGNDKSVAIISLNASLKVTHEVQASAVVIALDFSADCRYIAVGCGKKVSIVSTRSWAIIHEVEHDDDLVSLSFSPDGRYISTACQGKDVAVIGLGPLLSGEFAPVHFVKQAINTEQNDEIAETMRGYCRSSPAKTLLQRCIDHNFDINDIEKLLKRYPRLLCAENSSTDTAYNDIFATAIHRRDPKLLLALLSTAFGPYGQALLSTNASDLIFKYQSEMILQYPDVWTRALKSMVLIPHPANYTTSVAKCSAKYMSASTNEITAVPWSDCDMDENGEILAVVVPHQHLGTLETLALLSIKCAVAVLENDVMGFVLEVVWRDHIKMYFYLDFLLFSSFCILWIWFQELVHGENESMRDTIEILVLYINTFYFCKELVHLGASMKSGMMSRSLGVMESVMRYEWNFIDLVATAMVFWSVFVAKSDQNESESSVIIIAVTAFVLTLNFLSYMRGFDKTGWLITVLSQNAMDVSGFMIILLVILFGFAVIFKTLLRTVEGSCSLELSSEDGGSTGSLKEVCDVNPFVMYPLTAFSVFNMGIMVSYVG